MKCKDCGCDCSSCCCKVCNCTETKCGCNCDCCKCCNQNCDCSVTKCGCDCKVLVHHHLIVRATVKNPLTKEETTKAWLKDLVEKIGMKIVSGPHAAYVSKEGNKGMTGAVIIETSHCAIHVWEETDPALVQLDVYTCSPLDLKVVFDHMSSMEPVKMEYKFLDRETGLVFVDK